MKLNNKGWGTLEMFLLSGGLLIALLVSVFFIHQFYKSLNLEMEGKQYVDLERKLETAARKYVYVNNIEINGEYKISYDTLKSQNIIKSLKDSNNKECDGYVMVSRVSNDNYFYSRISCENYQTKNY